MSPFRCIHPLTANAISFSRISFKYSLSLKVDRIFFSNRNARPGAPFFLKGSTGKSVRSFRPCVAKTTSNPAFFRPSAVDQIISDLLSRSRDGMYLTNKAIRISFISAPEIQCFSALSRDLSADLRLDFCSYSGRKHTLHLIAQAVFPCLSALKSLSLMKLEKHPAPIRLDLHLAHRTVCLR